MQSFIKKLVSVGLGMLAGYCAWQPTTAFSQTSPSILWQRQSNSDRINAVVFSPDGGTLISGSSDRLINLWQASNGTLLQTLNSGAEPVHASSVEWLAINGDGSRLASCNYQTVKLWRLPQGSEQDLSGHSDWVVSVAFSPNGSILASASFDTTVKIWRVSDGVNTKTLSHNGEVRVVAFSPNGQFLASAGADGSVHIWRTSDWAEVASLTGHTDDIYTMAFSPDGSTIAAGGYDHTVLVWNTSNWSLKYTLQGDGNVYALGFSPDSSQLAFSDGEANHLYLYRVSDGKLIRTYTSNVDNVQSLAFSKNGVLGYGRADNTVVVASLSGNSQPPPQQTPPPQDPPQQDPPQDPPSQQDPPPSDTTSQLVWQSALGNAFIWDMAGTNKNDAVNINRGKPVPGWRLAGVADFDGDGQSDLLWQNPGGALSLWLMNGTVARSSFPLRTGQKNDPKWRVIGVGDFNGDGQTDILWQHTSGVLRVWFMSGTNFVDSTSTSSLGDSPSLTINDGLPIPHGWRIAAVADFNKDGNPDIILQSTKGDVQVWLMNGTDIADTIDLSGEPTGSHWRVVGVADYNNDGQPDLLLRHNGNGVLAVWFMNGTDFQGSTRLNKGKPTNLNWRIVEAK